MSLWLDEGGEERTEMVLVPRVPSEAMLKAATDVALAIVREQAPHEPDLSPREAELTRHHSERVWTAMLAAAPALPAEQEGE